MPATTDTFSGSIARAVRAEMARQDKRLNELTAPLGRSWPTISGRLNGHTPFTADELDKVAQFLGITTYDLIESAALGERFAETKPTALEVEPSLPERDPWAQPSRAKKRGAA